MKTGMTELIVVFIVALFSLARISFLHMPESWVRRWLSSGDIRKQPQRI